MPTLANALRRSGRWSLRIATAALAGVLVHACTNVTDPSLIPVPIQSLAMAPVADTIVIGDSTQLHAVSINLNGTPFVQPGASWESSDPMVATVTGNGRVHGVAPGAATITATMLGFTATANIFVTPRPAFVASDDSVAFTGVANGPAPSAQTIDITNGGGGILSGMTVDSVVYTGMAGWLNATLATGVEPDVLTLQPSTTSLPVGTYVATVFVSAPSTDNSPLQIKASFDVTVGAAASIALESGDGQTAAVNTAVAVDPAVIVRDAFNNPVSGAAVTFVIAGGSGSVLPVAAVLTGVDGIARLTSWTLGTIVGANSLTVSSGGLTGSPITFSATSIPGPAAQVAKFAGDAQSTTVGTQVAAAPTVRVTDQFGNVVAGTSVTFLVASGGGSATGTAATSDAAGLASVGTWTLGTTSGANTMSATSAGLTGSPLTFTATGTVGAATQIVKSGGDLQTAAAGSAVAIDPSVTVRDQFGNGVPGASVTFAVALGGGAVNPATPIITNALGVATVTSWTLGNVAGANSLTATSGALSGSPLTFTATGTAGAATTIAKISGDAQTDSIGKKLTTALRVRVTDALGNGVSGVVVTWAGTGGATLTNATSTTDATGFAPDTLTLGNVAGAQGATATAAGLSGSPLSFTATATPGNATTIALNAGSAQTDTIGAPLAIQYAVRVSDRANNAKPGVTVTWGATGGSITPSSITAANGIAVANRTLGNTTGAQPASATVAGLTGSPVAFTAIATNGNATAIVLNTGNAQSDTIGAPLAIAYSVRITDRAANSVVGATVNWTAPAGSITASSVTNAGGIASATRTLGNVAGAQPATATAVVLPGSPIGFTATATAGNPTTIAKNGGDAQGATVNTALPIAPSVIVTDRAGNPVAGRSVTFATLPNNGTVVPVTPILTNASGIAQVTSWTMGAVAKPDTMTATSAGLAGSPLIFTANAISGSASAIALSAGNAQTDTIGATLAVQYAVFITDNIGNPVAGIPVSWAVTGGGGSITPTSNSNASGIAVATRILGNTAGAQTATASVGGLTGSPVLFTATANVGAAKNIAVNAGNGQSATVATNVATPPSVLVTDRAGNVVSGVSVTFAVTGGGGSVNPVSAILTNASGIAQVTSWTLGQTAGTSNNTLSATSAGLTGSPVVFSASGLAGAATQIALNAGNNQTATVNTNVATPPSVIVRDQFNNPVSGVSVTFAVTGGGGSVNPVSAILTNASGIAQVTSWTMGTGAGTNNNTLSATSAGLGGSPVAFTASATAGAANQIAVNAGNGQSATVNTNVATPPSVLVRDQFLNPVSGVSVTFAVTGGGGSVNPGTAILTNASGIAQVTSWTLGTGAGTNNNTLSATSVGLSGSPVVFTASALAGAAAQISPNAGNNQSATVNTNVATPPSVIVRDVFLNPVSGASVTFAVTGGGGSVNPGTAILTNASGIAQVTTWTMGTVAGTNNNTLSATAALAGSPVVFTASANPGAVNAAQSSVVAGTASITACSSSCTLGTLASLITVTVRDQFANVIQGASVTISVSGSNNVLTPSASGSSSASGVYTAILNSTLAQAKTISATGNAIGITQTAAVTVNAAGVSVSNSLLNAATSTITACQLSCSNTTTASLVTITIRDAFSNAISGATVTPSCSVGVNCQFVASSGTTNASGVFTTSFRSDSAQAKTIRATVTGTGLINATDGVTVVAAAPAAVAVTNHLFSIRVATGAVTRPTFTVTDAFGNRVTSYPVSYSVPFGGASGPSATNSSGQATLTSWVMSGSPTDDGSGRMPNTVTMTAGSASNTATNYGIYTWSGDAAPLIGPASTCTGCHGITFNRNPNTIVGVASSCAGWNYVVAGAANSSHIYRKIDGTQACGVQMPQGGPFMSTTQRKIIRTWINNGAPNN